MQIETGDITPTISTPIDSSMLDSMEFFLGGEFRRADGGCGGATGVFVS